MSEKHELRCVLFEIVKSERKQYGFTDSCHDRGWYGPDECAQTVFRNRHQIIEGACGSGFQPSLQADDNFRGNAADGCCDRGYGDVMKMANDILPGEDKHRAKERGEALKLNEEERAFYDALENNDSAIQVLGDETLRTIAREVADALRKNVTIDWTLRENVRAQLRVIIKRILRKYGYPPDKQEKATQTVLEQVELLGWEVAAA